MLGVMIAVFYSVTRPVKTRGRHKPDGYAHLYSIYYGAAGDRLYGPTEVATDKDGNMYVADTYKHRVLVYDRDGKYIGNSAKRGTGKYEFTFPDASG